MSINLIHEEIQTREVVCQKHSQTMVECDMIVPDVKPDIRKVLEVSGTAAITQKQVQQDKAMIQGLVKMTVLYLPDGEQSGIIRSLSATQEFNHTMDCRGATPQMQILAQAEPENFDSALINSRKLHLRCSLGLQVKVSRPLTLSLPVGVEDESGIALNREPLRLICNHEGTECQIILREQLEMPSGKPTIGEILKITASPVPLELCMMENKAVAKGQVRVCTLYLSEDEEASLQVAEHMIPFTEILDAEGIHEDMDGELVYNLNDMYYEIREDSDGESRNLGVELVLGVLLRGTETKEIEALCDAYSLTGSLAVNTAEQQVEQLLASNTAELTIKDQAQLPPMLPKLGQVCDLNSHATIDRITAENGQVTVFGTIQTWILYLTRDESSPISAFRHISEFSHSFPVPELPGNTACDARVSVTHTSYTLSGEDSLELRLLLSLAVKSLKTGSVCLLESMTETDAEENTVHPCMVLYFVQKGDTLWKIAKRYHTTVDAIKTLNRLDCDTIYPGQKLKIMADCCKTA